LTGWVRSADLGVEATALVADGRRVISQTIVASSTWQAITVTYPVAADSDFLRVGFGVGRPGDLSATGTLLVDDVCLTILGQTANLLHNGGAESGRRRLEPFLEAGRRFAKLPQGWPEVLFSAESYRPEVLRRYALYAALTFAGFWGNFGWLQLPLPVPVYLALAAVCTVSGVGWLRLLLAQGMAELAPWQRRTLGWLAASSLLALLQVLLPMIGRTWQPQGRYLFPALWPLTMLLFIGLRAWVPATGRSKLLVAWIAGLIALDGLALFGTLLPAYH
jgi:hypothetical protein